MDPPPLWAALLTGACAFCCGTFTQSLREFSRDRLDKLCAARGQPDRFGQVLRRREEVLVVVRAATFVLNVAAVILFAGACGLPLPGAAGGGGGSGPWAGWEPWAGWAALGVGSVFVLSVLPWTVARVAAEPLLARLWPLVSGVAVVPGGPLVFVSTWLDHLLHRLVGRTEPVDKADAAVVLGEELRSVVVEGEREGLIEVDAGRMIRKVIELRAEDVAAVMTPRPKMVTLPEHATLEEARQLLLDKGHSRVPVVRETIDDVAGVLYAKDLLGELDLGADLTPEERAERWSRSVMEVPPRPPVFVPDTTPLDTLLGRMKQDKTHIALVVDEYSNVVGLVTLEDLLEEIVGEIIDEHDDPELEVDGITALHAPPPAAPPAGGEQTAAAAPAALNGTGPKAFEVAGWVRTDQLNEAAGFELPEDGDFDTVAGFVFSEMKRVPGANEGFDWNGLRVTVTKAEARQIDLVRVEELPPAD